MACFLERWLSLLLLMTRSNLFHGLLSSPRTPSTLPRCLSRQAERRLTAGLWLTQAHAYVMALAGVLPGPAAAITRRCLSSHSPIASGILPSFMFSDNCELAPPRATRSLTLHPWTGFPHTNRLSYLVAYSISSSIYPSIRLSVCPSTRPLCSPACMLFCLCMLESTFYSQLSYNTLKCLCITSR